MGTVSDVNQAWMLNYSHHASDGCTDMHSSDERVLWPAQEYARPTTYPSWIFLDLSGRPFDGLCR